MHILCIFEAISMSCLFVILFPLFHYSIPLYCFLLLLLLIVILPSFGCCDAHISSVCGTNNGVLILIDLSATRLPVITLTLVWVDSKFQNLFVQTQSFLNELSYSIVFPHNLW